MVTDFTNIMLVRLAGLGHKVRRYFKRIDKADPAYLEIWIEETKKTPLRYQIGLNENYGVTMLMELESFKP